jgi:hypothetical protein
MGRLPAKDLKNEINRVRQFDDAELRRLIHTESLTSTPHIAAKHVLEKRERWRRFWSKDIVAWLALVLSIISLLLSLSMLNN